MAQIRVDQSHCNYHLTRWLQQRGWEILFTDAGRVSRGGSGTQGAVLKIFEESGLPIPDIVAVTNTQLLIIEIDSVFTKARPSLETYRRLETFILEQINTRLRRAEQQHSMLLGFCRTGIMKKPATYFSSTPTLSSDVDLWIVFTEPEKPLHFWARHEHVEK